MPEGRLDLWLVRHGPTAPNAERRYPRADEDADLAPGGAARLAPLRDFLPRGAAAFTSPARRARRTAEAAGFPHAGPDAALREADFGLMAGRTWAELEAAHGAAPRAWIDALADPDADLGPPGGETGRAFHARVGAWLDALPDGETVAFTHAGVVLAALRLAVGLRAAEVEAGAAALLRRAGGAWWLAGLNRR